jgi:hypothetical protein
MKRTIAGIVMLVTLSAGTVFAEDGWRYRREIRRDEAGIARDKRELRRDLYRGNYRAARQEKKELRREYRELRQDRQH